MTTYVKIAQALAAGEVTRQEAVEAVRRLQPALYCHEDPTNIYDGEMWYEGDQENSLMAVQSLIGGTSYTDDDFMAFVEVVGEARSQEA